MALEIHLIFIVHDFFILGLEICVQILIGFILVIWVFKSLKDSVLLLVLFNAKLSHFGLAKAGPTGDCTHVSTQVLGTRGYGAPEYIATGLLVFF